MSLTGTFRSLTAHLRFGGCFPSLVRVSSWVLFSSPSKKPSYPMAPHAPNGLPPAQCLLSAFVYSTDFTASSLCVRRCSRCRGYGGGQAAWSLSSGADVVVKVQTAGGGHFGRMVQGGVPETGEPSRHLMSLSASLTVTPSL